MPPLSPIQLDDAVLVQASSRIVSCELDGEAVLLDPQAGLYFGLNDVGAAIWSMLASPCRLGDLCGSIVSRFDVDDDTCRDDVKTLVEELLARGLAVFVAARE
ncbi:MAG: PqqD family protein [Acidobacteria bacterium]|nr:PqqD family protein [Acidobacteriota bacterium]